MHGMPHAWLLWWYALLWGHNAAHGCHWGSSRMGLTRPGYETLVTWQLGLHLFLLAGTTHRAHTQTKIKTMSRPLQYRDKQSEIIRDWVPMLASPDFTLRIFKFRIILQHNHREKLLSKVRTYNLEALSDFSGMFQNYPSMLNVEM